MKKSALILFVLLSILGVENRSYAQQAENLQNGSVGSSELARQIVESLPNRETENQGTVKIFSSLKDYYVSSVTRDNPGREDEAKAIVESNFDPTASSYIAAYDEKKIQIFSQNFTPGELKQIAVFYSASDASALSDDLKHKLVRVVGNQVAQLWKPFMLTLIHNTINQKIAGDLTAAGLHVPAELIK